MTATKGKLAIVTGGGSGIGLAIAEKFVQQGIQVIIAGRDAERLNAAQQKLGALCHAITCDVTDLAAIPAFVQSVIDQYGSIDILVNNAGTNRRKISQRSLMKNFNTSYLPILPRFSR